MAEGPEGTEIVPDPDVERAASALLRDVVRYIVESGDEPDATPERLEAATGVVFGAEIAGGYVHADEHDKRYRCMLDFTPGPSDEAGIVLDLTASDPARGEWRPLVLEPDVTQVSALLEQAGFRSWVSAGPEGSFSSLVFLRGAHEVEITWRWWRAFVDPHRCVTGVAAHWGTAG